MVVVILGVLAATAMPAYRSTVEQGRSGEAKTNLSIIHMGQKIYAINNGGNYWLPGNNPPLAGAVGTGVNATLNIEIKSQYYTISSITGDNGANPKTFTAIVARNGVSGVANSKTYQIDQNGTITPPN